MFRPSRLALAAATAAAVLVPVGAAAASTEPPAGQPPAAHYCAGYDAYEVLAQVRRVVAAVRAS